MDMMELKQPMKGPFLGHLVMHMDLGPRIDKQGKGKITFGEFETFFEDEAVKVARCVGLGWLKNA